MKKCHFIRGNRGEGTLKKPLEKREQRGRNIEEAFGQEVTTEGREHSKTCANPD